MWVGEDFPGPRNCSWAPPTGSLFSQPLTCGDWLHDKGLWEEVPSWRGSGYWNSQKREESVGTAEDLGMNAQEETGTPGSVLALFLFTFSVQLPALHPSGRPIDKAITDRLRQGLQVPGKGLARLLTGHCHSLQLVMELNK